MSKYTTELRWVVEQTLDDMKLTHDESNWSKCWKVLGLDDYPLFDESHRDELNCKIVRRYYTREIGAETVGRWKMFVRDAMHSIMPYYNQLYESEAKVKGIDFMNDRDLTTTSKQLDSGKSESASESSQTGHADTTTTVANTVGSTSHNESTSNDVNVFSDTPQSMLPEDIKAMKYASSVTVDTVDSSADASGSTKTDGTTTVAADDTASASGSGTGSYDNTSELTRHEVGVLGSRSTLLKEWRESMMNIDEMVLDDRELRECFMTVW